MKLFAVFLLATLCVSAVLVNGQSEDGHEEEAHPEDGGEEAEDGEPSQPDARQARPPRLRIVSSRTGSRVPVRSRPVTRLRSPSPVAQLANPTTGVQANPAEIYSMFNQLQTALQAMHETLQQMLLNSSTPPPSPPALQPVVVQAATTTDNNNGTVAVQARMSDEQLGEVVDAISRHLTDLMNNNPGHRNHQ